MKTDKELGRLIQLHLIDQGVETPTRQRIGDADKIRKQVIIDSITDIMTTGLGLDLEDDSLKGTPERIARMYMDEIFYGLDINKFPKVTTVENRMQYDEMILIKDISVSSTCEHHFVVIDGIAHVAYIPKKKIVGLSKINRVVEYFSKRPQIQERLTEQIYHALCFILETDDIAVVINATHYCVKSRGVKDINSSTTTSKLGGIFREGDVRNEFMNLIR